MKKTIDWKNISLKELQSDKELLKMFFKDYKQKFAKPCLSCPNKLNLYLKQYKNTLKMSKAKTCILKEGVLLYDAESHVHYNAETITDEVASRLIAKAPKVANKFVKVPSKPRKKKEEAPVVETPAAELPADTTPEAAPEETPEAAPKKKAPAKKKPAAKK